jgi:diaminopimelate decarboxylase
VWSAKELESFLNSMGYATPCLCYHTPTLRSHRDFFSAASEPRQLSFLFAVKSFPHPEMLSVLNNHILSFDVSNAAEARLALENAQVERLSLCAPALDKDLLSLVFQELKRHKNEVEKNLCTFQVSCETLAQVQLCTTYFNAQKLHFPHCQFGILFRIESGSLLSSLCLERKQKIPASRFGMTPTLENLQPCLEAAGEFWQGFHLHHGFPQHNGIEEYTHFATELWQLAQNLGVGERLRTVNFGGGLWPLSNSDLLTLFAQVRSQFPPSVHVLFEPGRRFTKGAGWALTRVRSAKTLTRTQGRSTHVRVVDLSRVGHLKWSNSAPRVPLPVVNHSRSILEIVGPTCYEDDLFLRQCLEETQDADTLLPVGSLVLLEGVTGYSSAWNHSFNGLPQAQVVFFDL